MEKIEKTFTGMLVHTRGMVNQAYHMNNSVGESMTLVLTGVGQADHEAWNGATVTVTIEYDPSREIHLD